jgi:hypothetical protein
MRKVIIGLIFSLGEFVALFSFPSPPLAEPCSEEWAEHIERYYVRTSDPDGHGPDPLDWAWFNAVESALNMEPVMTKDSQAYCAAIARQIATHRYIRSRLFGELIRLF